MSECKLLYLSRSRIVLRNNDVSRTPVRWLSMINTIAMKSRQYYLSLQKEFCWQSRYSFLFFFSLALEPVFFFLDRTRKFITFFLDLGVIQASLNNRVRIVAVESYCFSIDNSYRPVKFMKIFHCITWKSTVFVGFKFRPPGSSCFWATMFRRECFCRHGIAKKNNVHGKFNRNFRYYKKVCTRVTEWHLILSSYYTTVLLPVKCNPGQPRPSGVEAIYSADR